MPHGLSEPLCDQITIRRYRAIASLRATGRCAGTTAVRASADRSADERACVLFGSEDKVRFDPKKRRHLDQLQFFQTGVTLLPDDDVVLDRNTELLSRSQQSLASSRRQHAMVLGLLPDDCASAQPIRRIRRSRISAVTDVHYADQ